MIVARMLVWHGGYEEAFEPQREPRDRTCIRDNFGRLFDILLVRCRWVYSDLAEIMRIVFQCERRRISVKRDKIQYNTLLIHVTSMQNLDSASER